MSSAWFRLSACAAVWLPMLAACSIAGGGSADGGANGASSGGGSGGVCVYRKGGYATCVGLGTVNDDDEWQCSSAPADLNDCKAQFSRTSETSGDCIFVSTYRGHTMVAGDCQAALADVGSHCGGDCYLGVPTSCTCDRADPCAWAADPDKQEQFLGSGCGLVFDGHSCTELGLQPQQGRCFGGVELDCLIPDAGADPRLEALNCATTVPDTAGTCTAVAENTATCVFNAGELCANDRSIFACGAGGAVDRTMACDLAKGCRTGFSECDPQDLSYVCNGTAMSWCLSQAQPVLWDCADAAQLGSALSTIRPGTCAMVADNTGGQSASCVFPAGAACYISDNVFACGGNLGVDTSLACDVINGCVSGYSACAPNGPNTCFGNMQSGCAPYGQRWLVDCTRAGASGCSGNGVCTGVPRLGQCLPGSFECAGGLYCTSASAADGWGICLSQ